MNFFRKRYRRDVLAAHTVDPDTHSIYSGSLEKEYLAADKPKRQSYFSLRRHEVPSTATAPVVKTVMLASGDDSDTPEKNILRKKLSCKFNGESNAGVKTLRRRSIPVISYLISKRSEPKLSDTENTAPSTDSQEDTILQQQQQQQQQHINERRTSESSSGDESSGGESDDTLATQDCSDALAVFGADLTNGGGSTAAGAAAEEQLGIAALGPPRLFPSLAMAAAGNGSGAGSLDHTQCSANGGMARACNIADNAPPRSAAFIVRKDAETALSKPTQHKRRTLLLHTGLPETSSPVKPSAATAATDAGSVDTPLQRRQLTLGRLGASTEMRGSQDVAGRKTHWHKQLVQRKVASAVRSTLAGIHSSTENSKAYGLLGSPVRMVLAGTEDSNIKSDGEPKHRLRIKAHSRAQKEINKRRSGNGLGRLFHPPPLTAAEQKRMDAWAADDDEFSTDEYDLTGAYFELPAIDVLAAELRTTARKGDEGTKGSRLSSTSTVVDDGALSPELSKRLFVASARKLQWPGNKRREMAALLHIRNTMARANEHYVVASGGRRLDGHSTARAMVAELHSRDDHYYESAVLARTYSSHHRNQPAATALVPDRDLIGFGTGDLVSLDPAIAGSGSVTSCGRYQRPRRHRSSRRWREPRSCSSGGVASAISVGGMP
ncbi:hypothetical protein LPJ74_001619 [Coemansia sp. RSA 1843]|nr:hypothetical protein LPJ74_001619 [Coemansia sp. RSA 1843]